jgi:antitoxin component YwqK of YwqJK toxin-antitoxin module
MENPEDLDLDNNEVLDRIIPKAAKKLVGRRGLMFKPKKQTPYTGWYVEFYEDDAIELLLHYRVGKWDGPARSWYNNGRKEKVIKFKAGKQDGVSLEWYGDGKKNP